jgi:hypothetical protein
MLATENWCIKVKDKVYGPYTTQQMRKFAHEGRLATWSMISPAGATAWREAKNETVFANFFGAEPVASPLANGRAFGKRNDWEDDEKSADIPARGVNANGANPQAIAHAKTKRAASQEPHAANFIVIFDVVSGAASRVEAAVMSLGHAFRIADNVWSISCELTAVGVRNAIAPYLRGSESIFVIDATRGRTSWRNYAPETQAKITAAYLTSRVA